MKILKTILAVTILTITSCSSDANLEETSNETFLKSYKLTRDSQGRYSVDYELKENTSANIIKNIETNTNEIHLFSGKVAVENKQSQTLLLENDQLQLGFYENGEKGSGLIVEDDAIALAKGEESEEFLETYSITDLGNDNYQLDFKVKEGISVSFEYNQENEAYEVHLNEGAVKDLTFSKTYIKTQDVLKIDFINHKDSYSAKSLSTSGKPRLIVN